MNIFVGNLSFGAVEADVKKLFEGFGNVASVAIVMRKEKKAPKSRGFGFVEMPDEQQALAAIAALNGKEFMGRVLNVDPARPNPTGIGLPIPIKEGPKTEVQRENELEEKGQKPWFSPVFNKHHALKDGQVRPSGQHLALKDGQVRPSGQHLALKDGQVRPSGRHLALSDGKCALSGRPGTYKGGRRTHSYMKRRGLAGMQEEVKPWRRSQDNPMRWRKRKNQPRPWQKSPGEHKPWEKAEKGARPWKKAEGEPKPWRKSEGGWSKSSERPQKSRFNPSTSSFDKFRTNPERVKRVEGSLGMVRGNGERPSTTLRTALSERSESNGRSRTKGRKKPGGYKR